MAQDWDTLETRGNIQGHDFVADEDILAVLKFSGLAVGLISALWSTTQKITYEVEGVKRLTLQGRVMVGIIITSSFISVLALGLDVLAKKEKERNAVIERAAAAQEQDRNERRAAEEKAQAKRERSAELEAQMLRSIRADAKEQNRFLEQRFVILDLAAEQQRRDSGISMRIAREANLRLSEAERTLAEFERINYPLRRIDAGVTLALGTGGVNFDDFWREIESNGNVSWSAEVHNGDRIFATIGPNLIPQSGPLHDAITRTVIRLVFATPGESHPSSAGNAQSGIRILETQGIIDGQIDIPLEIQTITLNRKTRQITAYFSGAHEPPVEGVVKSGDKLSLSDVNRLAPILTVERNPFPEFARRSADSLVGVSYGLNGLERFHATPAFRITEAGSFLLAPEPPRRGQ